VKTEYSYRHNEQRITFTNVSTKQTIKLLHPQSFSYPRWVMKEEFLYALRVCTFWVSLSDIE